MIYAIIAIILWWIVRDYIKDRKIEKDLEKDKQECIERSDNNA